MLKYFTVSVWQISCCGDLGGNFWAAGVRAEWRLAGGSLSLLARGRQARLRLSVSSAEDI
jgi:hypothetical protein